MSKKLDMELNLPKEDIEYEKIIGKMEREIKRLKTENKMLTNSLEATEEYLMAISANKTTKEIFLEVKNNTETKIQEKCPNCGSKNMKKINLVQVKIISCSCGYRNRVNETTSTQT